MAELTNRTFLMHKGSSAQSYAKLVDIIDFTDIGTTPETVEITTLSDMERRYMLGIQENEPITFTALYDGTEYSTLKALEGDEENYAIYFGGTDASTPTGDDGQFTFKGYLSVYVNGGAVNEARQMTVVIAPSTAIEFS